MPDQDDRGKAISASIKYPEFDDTTPVFANNMTVQFLGGEYVVRYYAVFPPILVGSEEEKRTRASEISDVPATCVAKVVVPRGIMPSLVKALSENVARHQPESVMLDSTEDPGEDGDG